MCVCLCVALKLHYTVVCGIGESVNTCSTGNLARKQETALCGSAVHCESTTSRIGLLIAMNSWENHSISLYLSVCMSVCLSVDVYVITQCDSTVWCTCSCKLDWSIERVSRLPRPRIDSLHMSGFHAGCASGLMTTLYRALVLLCGCLLLMQHLRHAI